VLGIGAEDAIVRLTVRAAARPEPKPESVAHAPAPRLQPTTPAVRPEPTPAARPQPVPETARPPSFVPAPPAPTRDDKAMTAIQIGQDFLVGLLTRMNLPAKVEIVPQSDAEADEGDRLLVLNIVGENLGVLIGRQNETLSALEFITRLVVNQQSRTRSNFSVDVNGYRAKRAESLHKLALRMADQVAQAGRTMALEPMTPAERRIIHLALRDHPRVTTQSVGEGDRRKVTIIPKKEQ
jgi:spoIIIJ-associated protein